MNVLVVPRISSSPLSPFASPHPFNLVEGILDASFHRFFFPGATIIRGSVSLSKSKSPPYRRFDETGKDKLELLYRGRGEKAGLLISVPFKAEGGKNAARRVSKSLASRSSFSSSCVPGKLSLSSSLSISLFFSSLLETHRKLSSPPFPSRASRFIRFSSAKISILFGRGIDTFSSSSPDIPDQPAPLPYVSLSRTRIYETTRSRE